MKNYSKEYLTIQKGEVVFFTTGEYSDFGLRGEVVFIKDCELREVVEKYREKTNPQKEDYNDDLYGFADHLIAEGYCMPIENRTIHLGSYGTFEVRG